MITHKTVKRYQQRLLAAALLLTLFLCSQVNVVNAQSQPAKDVLVFNSYHQGYKWSDDIMSGIASILGTGISNVRLQTEYMDAQRIADAGYLQKLAEVYAYKFRGKRFDAIIASDDPAFNFLLKHRRKLFSDSPLVFCGVNYFVDSMLKGQPNVTGVVEAQDIGSTLELALKLHPQTREVYIVNDNSITGQAIAKDLSKVAPQFKGRVKFTHLSNKNMDQLQQDVSRLPADSLILYLIFFEDGSGRKFSYSEGISRIASHSNVPIYGVWDFSLGYGIVGGMLTSGFFQGEQAATLARRILNGEPAASISVVKQGSNRYMFDSTQIKRFKIKFSSLPPDSIIINESDSRRKQVLVINSYHYGMNWTDRINDGITSQLGNREKNDLHVEFMDIKRNVDPEYVQQLYKLYRHKLRGRKFDLVITSDDDAYNLARKYHAELFPNVPIVFCGVNFFQADDIRNDRLITGVVEAVDIKKTLAIALKLHAGIRKVVVINDLTATGMANRKLVDAVLADFSGVEFEFFDDLNMSELEERVAALPADNLILLLSFNRDKSNNAFSYEESLRRISAKAKIPIYGVWDFYLGSGIVGGMVTNGFSQGELAAKIGARILGGEQKDRIPVEMNSPNRYMFDYRYLKQFGIDPAKLPGNSVIINQPNMLMEKYGRSIAVILTVLVAVSAYIFYRRKKSRDMLKLMAETDALTEILNRRAGIAYMKQLIKSANLLKAGFIVCFVDLDKLKTVNDTLGHHEGDRYLQESSRILQHKIRQGDLLCRYGGDEFLIAISNCNREQAGRLWEKIEENIQAFNQASTTNFTISMSRGFSEYSPNAPVTISDLIDAADAEMYKFKQQRKANADM